MFLPAHEFFFAEVAELADALASGASGRKAIGVRVPASAPDFAASRLADEVLEPGKTLKQLFCCAVQNLPRFDSARSVREMMAA